MKTAESGTRAAARAAAVRGGRRGRGGGGGRGGRGGRGGVAPPEAEVEAKERIGEDERGRKSLL